MNRKVPLFREWHICGTRPDGRYFSFVGILLTALLASFTTAFAETQSARVLHFPPERSLGEIFVQEETHALSEEDWRLLGPAKGDVAVPAGVRAKLKVSDSGLRDLSPLSRLAPDALYGIAFWGEKVNDRTLSAVAGLTGLRVLELTLTRVGDRGLQQIAVLRSLESLSLPSATTDAGLACVATNLSGLKALAFKNPRVTNAGLRHLAQLPSLTTLYLCGPWINDDGLVHLASLPKLESLTIWGPTFTGRGFVHLRKVPSLRVFHSARIPTVRDAGLKDLAALPHLEKVILFDNAQISDAGMTWLAQSRSLRWLDIDKTRVTEKGVAALMQNSAWEYLSLPQGSVTDGTLILLGQQINLTHLGLGLPNRERPYSVKGLAELAKIQRLEYLQIGGPGVTDAAMNHVAQHRNLKQLNLRSCPITDPGLARLTGLRSLEQIQLSATRDITANGLSLLNTMPQLTDISVEQIAGGGRLDFSKLVKLRQLIIHMDDGVLGNDSVASLQGLHQLESLQLPSTAISDEGMASLRGLTNLFVLVIGGPGVTDRGVAHLAGMKRLQQLWLKGNITETGRRALRELERLQDLKVGRPEKQRQAPIKPFKFSQNGTRDRIL